MKSAILFRDDGFSQVDEFLKLFDQGLEFGVAWIGFQRGFDGLKLVRVLACGRSDGMRRLGPEVGIL